MSYLIDSISRNCKVPTDVVKKVLDEYVKSCLYQLAFTGSSYTPFGVISLSNSDIRFVVKSPIVQKLLTESVSEDELSRLISEVIDSHDVRTSD